MDVPWTAIDHVKFEALALEFVRERYPNQHWTSLPLTRDGNRDAESLLTLDLLNSEFTVQAWMEAKYTRHHDTLIPKAHLDSTLVSALIEPSVQAVVFVTNGRFDGNYVARAQRALRIARHARDPSFFDRRAVERWLFEHPRQFRRYFGRALAPPAKLAARINIDSADIVRAEDYRSGHFQPTRRLFVDQPLNLQLLLSSAETVDVSVRIDAKALALESGEAFNAVASAGLSPAIVPIVATRPIGLAEARIVVSNGIEEVEHTLSYRVEPAPLEIRSASQLRTIQALFECAAEHRACGGAVSAVLSGLGAAGKSWTLARFIEQLPGDQCLQRIQFAENHGDNARQICRALLFLTFGAAAEFSANPVRTIRTGDIDSSLVTELVAGSTNSIQALLTVQAIARGDFPGSLVVPFDRGEVKVLVLDDIHKLQADALDVMCRILRDFELSENNTFLVLGTRPDLPSTLTGAIDSVAQFRFHLAGPSLSDIRESLGAIVNPRLADVLAPELLRENADGMLGLQRAITVLKEFSSHRRRLADFDAGQAVEIIRNLGAEELVNRKRPNEERLTAQFVLLIEGGVEEAFLAGHGLATAANKLVEQGLLVQEFGPPTRFVARHDRFREIFVEHGLPRFSRLHELVQIYAAESPERRADVLGLLCRFGGPASIAYRRSALELLRNLIEETSFGQAKPLVQSLVALSEEDGGFRRSLPDVTYLELKFALAECVNHTESIASSLPHFEATLLQAQTMEPTIDTAAFILLSEAEILNCRFWRLDYRGFVRQADGIAKRAASFYRRSQGNERISKARHNALNRKMMAQAALDRDEQATRTFAEALDCARDLHDRGAEGNLLMDRAKCLLKHGPLEAKPLFAAASMLLGEQNLRRRLLICENQAVFAAVMDGTQDADALVAGSERLAKFRYHQEHATALLEMAAAKLVSNNVAHASHLLRSVQLRPSSLENPRRRMLTQHLLAEAAMLEGNVELALRINRESLNVAKLLGPSYRAPLLHNASLAKADKAVWAYAGKPRTLWIEPRIW